MEMIGVHAFRHLDEIAISCYDWEIVLRLPTSAGGGGESQWRKERLRAMPGQAPMR